MNKITSGFLSLIVMLFGCLQSYSATDTSAEHLSDTDGFSDPALQGETGNISLENAHCTLNVPEGYLFLNKEDSKTLLCLYWGNSLSSVENILGTLVKKDAGTYSNVQTAYVVSYDNAGYVSDKDAESIDYEELFKDMKKSLYEENKKNSAAPQWDLLGWAWKPSYDPDKKVLSGLNFSA